MRIRCPQCRESYEVTVERPERCLICGQNLFTAAGYAATPCEGTTGFDPGTRFDAMLDKAEEHGWDAAVRGRDDLAEWTLSNERANGLYLTKLGPQSVVLDYGCGFGSISIAAAATAREVVALDAAEAFVRGTAIRTRQASIGNVLPLRSDYMHLPFFENTFDLVIVNGVLEYIPCQHPSRPPMETVRDFLATLTRLLKPGGQLYLAIENRFGINYLLGARDEHSGLRFATILPRRLAHIYSLLATRRPYLTWTHSYFTLRRLFKAAGYSDARFYAALPDYRYPVHLVSLRHPGILNYFFRNSSRATGSLKRRIATAAAQGAANVGLARLPVWKVLVPSFACVFTLHTHPDNTSPAWLQHAAPVPVNVYVRKRRSNLSALLFERGAPQPYGMVRFTDNSVSMTRESSLLEHFRTHGSRIIDPWILHPYAQMPSLAGKALYYRWQSYCGAGPSLQDAEQFIAALQAVKLPEFLDTATHDRYIAERLAGVARWGAEMASWYAGWVDLCAQYGRFRIVHGDLHPGNFLRTRTGFAVIDWEYAHRGSPFEDLFFFGSWDGRRLSGTKFMRTAAENWGRYADIAREHRFEEQDVTAGLVCAGLRLLVERAINAALFYEVFRDAPGGMRQPKRFC